MKLSLAERLPKKIREQGRKKTWLAEQLNCDPTNIYKILKKEHLDCELLLRISILLDFDFFSFYSEMVKAARHNKE